MLGTTSTQVLGNQALNVVAGREASKQITRQAAAQAGASEMIAEYLLPVVAAMLVGALADASREGLESLMRRDGDETDPAYIPRGAAPVVAPLPQVAAGGVGFSGSTGGGIGLARPVAVSGRLVALAESIREGAALPGGRDAADATRRIWRRALSIAEGAARLDRSPSRFRRKRLQNGTRPEASMSLQAEGPKATDEGCGDYRQGRASTSQYQPADDRLQCNLVARPHARNAPNRCRTRDR